MESYKRGSHTVWDCKYHIVCISKYCSQVLGGDVGQRCRELILESYEHAIGSSAMANAMAQEMLIHAGAENRDHVHLLISIPPNLSVKLP